MIKIPEGGICELEKGGSFNGKRKKLLLQS